MRSVEESNMMDISVAESLADVERINGFFNSPEIKADLHWFTYRDTLVRAFEREDRRLLYVENEDGNIVGALMVWCRSRILDDGEAQIRLVAVAPNQRGQGIGKMLCEHAEMFARQESQDRMIADVVTSSPAVDFWKHLEYDICDEWESSSGRSMVTMKKKIR